MRRDRVVLAGRSFTVDALLASFLFARTLLYARLRKLSLAGTFSFPPPFGSGAGVLDRRFHELRMGRQSFLGGRGTGGRSHHTVAGPFPGGRGRSLPKLVRLVVHVTRMNTVL